MHIPLNFFRSHVMGQFRALADFIQHSEAQLQESYHTTRSQVVTELGTGPQAGEEPEEWIARYDGEIGDVDIRYRIAFSRIMRFSFVVMCFTMLESSLVRVAMEVVSRKQLTSRWEDRKEKGILKKFEAFWRCLPAPPLRTNSAWQLADEVRALRNCIAHRNGWFCEDDDNEQARRDDEKVRQVIDRDLGVGVVSADGALVDPDDVGSIGIEERFCPYVVKELTHLITEIFDRAGCFGQDG